MNANSVTRQPTDEQPWAGQGTYATSINLEIALKDAGAQDLSGRATPTGMSYTFEFQGHRATLTLDD